MQVRRAVLGDERVWVEAISALVLESDRDGDPLSESEAATSIEDERCYLFLALSDAEPVGLLTAFRFPNVEAGGQMAYLHNIEVSSKHRRQGVGSALIRGLLGACRADRVELVWAGTQIQNTAARAAFESTGAELEGESYAEYEWELWELWEL